MPEGSQTPVWTPPQTEALVAAQSFLLVGPAGSGKTATLLEKARRIGHAGGRVALTTFSYRVLEHLKSQGQPSLTPYAASGSLSFGTLYERAAAQLRAGGLAFTFATNNQVRQLLRALVAEQSFPGTLEEAEHVIRAAKGRAKKLPESDRFFPFVNAYQARLEALGLSDRHDLIRRHVLGIKDGSIAPLDTDWLLLDGLQDATELQLIWLQMHLAKGVKLGLAADDDVTAFGRDGALGPAALQQVAAWAETYDLDVVTLPASHRLGAPMMQALARQARQLRVRQPKGDLSVAPPFAATAALPPLAHHGFGSLPELHGWVADYARAMAQQGLRVGLIAYDDFSAAALCHALRQRGLGAASFARLVWEDPTAQVVLSSLHVLLGDSTAPRLMVLLLGLGLPAAEVIRWQEMGALQAPQWLAEGAPLPLEGITSPTTLQRVQRIRWALRAAHTLLVSLVLPAPQTFKALWGDLLPLLPQPEQRPALLALDMLLGLQGNLTEALANVMTETLPDMASPITVSPVREVRNHQFDVVMLVNTAEGVWPKPLEPTLGADHDHERRLWLLACSRSRGPLVLTHVGEMGLLARELVRQPA